VTIYVPAGYDENPEKRYPELYMHDGQNLFEPERAFIPGQHWRLREAADKAIGERTAEPMLIVGIDNGGAARVDEYTPTRDRKKKLGGKADVHAVMIVEELKPLIDAKYRTRPDARSTAIGGSSLGGLVSLYLGMRRPDIFTRLAVMSPSVWWDNRMILREVDQFAGKSRPRIWLDTGLREGAEALRDTRALRDKLRERGWNNGDFRYVEDRRGDHSERAWAGRARAMLEFLFPPQPL
jgi:predicted alpha/beta superfamily hydrolase